MPCNRRIGPDPSDVCKTPCFRILQKHGCPIHAPHVLSKHKPLRKSEEELNNLVDSDIEEETEVTLEVRVRFFYLLQAKELFLSRSLFTLQEESQVLSNLVSDECINFSHLSDIIGRLREKGPLEITDTSDSEETDEECDGPTVSYEEAKEDFTSDQVAA